MKKKTLPKKLVTPSKKANAIGKDESKKVAQKKLKASPNKVKAKTAAQSKSNDRDNSNNDSNSECESMKTDRKPSLKKLKKALARKTVAIKSNDVKEVVVRKRMASLNASAVMTATYEAERQLDKREQKLYKIEADESVAPKKAKEIKNELPEPKDVRIQWLFD